MRNPVSDSCPGLPGGDTYPGFIFDLSDPTAPTFEGYFSIPEVKEYTAASGFFFGDGEFSHIAAVSMQASGLVFYDFTNPLSPVAGIDYEYACEYDPNYILIRACNICLVHTCSLT